MPTPSKPPVRAPSRSRPLHWTAGFLHGLVRLAGGSPESRRRRALDRWSQHWHRWVRRLHRADTQHAADPPALVALRVNLVGCTRGQIVTALGTPAASSFPSSTESPPIKPRHYWHAETWYYPYNLQRRCIIALTFTNDTVTSVDEVLGPES